MKSSAPVRLTKQGGYTGFRVVHPSTGRPTGVALRGLTKRLDCNIFSRGSLPWYRMTSVFKKKPRVGTVKTSARKAPGRTRGRAVDAQITKMINGRAASKPKRPHRLTTMTLAALTKLKLRPIMAQRGLACKMRSVATAADVFALDESNKLVVLEIKCGYSGDRTAPARHKGKEQTLNGPLSNTLDCAYHRHLAQLTATRALFVREKHTLTALRAAGVNVDVNGADVRGVLLYVDDTGIEAVELAEWWQQRGETIIGACA